MTYMGKGEVYMYKITIEEAKEGMVVENSVHHPETGKLLIPYGTTLKEFMIIKLKRLGVREIIIADRYTLFVSPLERMKIHLKDVYAKLIRKYASDQVEGNLCNDMVSITKRVMEIIEEICQSEDILNFCIQMRMVKDEPIFEYSVLTSLFSGLVGGAMKLGKEAMYEVMTAGLLHDIGCLEMPFLIGKTGLQGQQELLWKEHPTYGYYFAIQQDIPRTIAEMILYHHECWDGSGYPKQLKGEEIPLGARIIGVCRSISRHMYFEHLQPYEALEYLYATSNVYYDKRVVDCFVENVALYPLGALVRLTTGEIGIICNVRKNRGPRPLVNVYYNRVHKPLSEPKLVDLGVERTVFITEILSE